MKNLIYAIKNLSFFVLMIIFVTDFYTYAQTVISRELTGFRGNDWESSVEKVKTTEKERYLQSFHGFGIDALSFSGNIAGLKARIDYAFKNRKLFEGTYIINSKDEIRVDFKKLENFLVDEYGNPNFRAGESIDSDSIWEKVTPYGKFKGPELFWKFNNGFIGLIASKFEDDITITVLYSNDKSIREYGSDRLISTDDYK